MRSITTRNREWDTLKNRVRIVDVVASRLGRSEAGSTARPKWRCPFHEDSSPSLEVDPDRQTWTCWPCNLRRRDAADFIMRIDNISFPKAVIVLREQYGWGEPGEGLPVMSTRYTPTHAGAARNAENEPTGVPREFVRPTVDRAKAALLGPEGRHALEYLRRERMLTDETIEAFGFGFVDRLEVPTRRNRLNDEPSTMRLSGISIPWRGDHHQGSGGTIAMVNVRKLDESKPKYVRAFTDPALAAEYPGPLDIRRSALPLILTEGEFDAALLTQELGPAAVVASLGASGNPTTRGVHRFARLCPRVFLALDGDDAGEKAASKIAAEILRESADLPARSKPRVVRARPPESAKDWTDAVRAGHDLRSWWAREHTLGVDMPDEF
ncbi:MAG: CHC2 zinc finger domain-containing protein [Isosphaeraceae bacterium]|nr:CHC2 zinc finger domain-containing protein [Isosphaeraceae bacterium]